MHDCCCRLEFEFEIHTATFPMRVKKGIIQLTWLRILQCFERLSFVKRLVYEFLIMDTAVGAELKMLTNYQLWALCMQSTMVLMAPAVSANRKKVEHNVKLEFIFHSVWLHAICGKRKEAALIYASHTCANTVAGCIWTFGSHCSGFFAGGSNTLYETWTMGCGVLTVLVRPSLSGGDSFGHQSAGITTSATHTLSSPSGIHLPRSGLCESSTTCNRMHIFLRCR